MFEVSVTKIQVLKIFRSATINSVSGNVRTKSKISNIRWAVISIRNRNRLSGRVRKCNAD